jgi:hypothetical protein
MVCFKAFALEQASHVSHAYFQFLFLLLAHWASSSTLTMQLLLQTEASSFGLQGSVVVAAQHAQYPA